MGGNSRAEDVTTEAQERAVHRAIAPNRVWLCALSASLMCGLACWVAGETVRGWFVGPNLLRLMSDEERLGAMASRNLAETKNVALAMGLFGGILGLGLGLAGAIARRSARVVMIPAITGFTAGTVAGVVAAFAAMPVFFRAYNQNPLSTGLAVPMLVHVLLWAPLGSVAGLAFGLGLGDRSLPFRTMWGGLIGAILGAMVYEIVGALALPLALTSQPISLTWGSRLLARLLVSLLVASGAAISWQFWVRKTVC